jgi:hypothetical protein
LFTKTVLKVVPVNARERFHAIMHFDKNARTLKWEFGYWAETMRRWYKEGLPRKKGMPEKLKGGDELFGGGIPWAETTAPFAQDVHDFFELDEGFERVPVNLLFCPQYEYKVLDEDKEHKIILDEYGIKKQVRKDESSIPRFIEWPVKNRDDWERIKAERLQTNIEKRLPDNFIDLVRKYEQRSFPLSIGGYPHGFFGTIRFLMGDEKLFTSYYDQPDLIHDINTTFCNLWIEIFSYVMDHKIELDCVDIWEDMSYRKGSLISPVHFKKFMMPYYKKISKFLSNRGVDNIWVDTDGDCWELIPLFLEGGVTGISPMEVQSGMDVTEVRKKYPRLQIYGGLDKRRAALGKENIDSEIREKIPFMLKQGGYIPYLDHLIPPDVPWSGFKYYRQELNRLIEEHARDVG